MTFKQIEQLVDLSKDEDSNLQTKIALSLYITECAIYVLLMKQKYNKIVCI